jgi:hypothetical protein
MRPPSPPELRFGIGWVGPAGGDVDAERRRAARKGRGILIDVRDRAAQPEYFDLGSPAGRSAAP